MAITPIIDEYTIELKYSNNLYTAKAPQGDTGGTRFIDLILLNGGEEYVIPTENMEYFIAGHNSGGKEIINQCSVIDNKIRVELSDGILSYSGLGKYRIQVIDTTNNNPSGLSSFAFDIFVEKAPYNMSNVKKSDEYTELVKLINEAKNFNTWSTGSGIPSSGTGTNGDLYLNTQNSDIYKKEDGAWTKIGNIGGTAVTYVYCGNEAISISCTNDRLVTNETQVSIPFAGYYGVDKIASTVTYSSLPSGITLVSNTASTEESDGSLILKIDQNATLGGITSSYDNVNILLTFTCNGITFNRIFSISKSIQGNKGDTGIKGDTGNKGDQGDAGTDGVDGQRGSINYYGTAITGNSTTPTVFPSSGITDALVGDSYTNTTTFYEYNCTIAGDASTARWVYHGTKKGADGLGSGDMLKSVYDTNDNGKVDEADDADKLGGELPSFYQQNTSELTAQTEIADEDYFPSLDNSDSSNKKVLWSLVKSTLKTYFDTLYNKYILPVGGVNIGGVKNGGNVIIDENGNMNVVTGAGTWDEVEDKPFDDIGNDGLKVTSDTLDVDFTKVQAILSDATTSVSGKMSATDKTKLDGIATGANNYTLPTMSDTVKGGAKVGTGLSMDGEVLNAAVAGLINDETDFWAQTGSTGQGADSFVVKEILDDMRGIVLTGTLTAAATSITFTDAAIVTDGSIEWELWIDSDDIMLTYTGGSIATGSATFTFPAQAVDIPMRLKIREV